MKKLILLFLVVIIAIGSADAQKRKRKKKKKKPVVIEQPAPEPPPEVPIDTMPPPPPPVIDSPVVEEPTVKPYERIVLNFDSSSNLIYYDGVVEQAESSSDSLYLRTKKWAAKTFVGGGKALYEVDKKAQKVIINGVLPAYNYSNKYAKKAIGRYQFKMTVWFKEERYKYHISNFVHEGSKGNIGASPRNYFEYYYTTTNNIKASDQILRYADKDIKEMIEDFKKSMKEPPENTEDEW